jgi:outer membrane protein assembly factor BamB
VDGGGDDPIVPPPPAGPDKTALIAAIDAANTAKSDVAVDTLAENVPTGTFWVIQAEMDALDTALAAARAVRNDTAATEAQVDQAKTNLTNATTAFTGQKKAGTYAGTSSTVWARTVTAGSYLSQFGAVAADSSGSIYAAGDQSGTGNYNYGSGTVTGTSGSSNAVLVKYNATGTALWARTVTTGIDSSQFSAAAADSSGNVYAAGYQSGAGNYNYGSGNIAGTFSSGYNAVLVKYTADGTTQWARTVMAGSSNSLFSAAAADSSGNIYAAGYQVGAGAYNYGSGNISGTSYSHNAVLVKYAADGTALWARTVTTGSDPSQFSAVAADSSGTVYATGVQRGTNSYNYGSGTVTGTSYGDNAVLVKYNAAGTAQWAKTVTKGNSASSFNAVAADSSGTVYAAGYQTGTGAYNYGSGDIAGTGTSRNAVLVKYAQ